jgi:hypothetical protein
MQAQPVGGWWVPRGDFTEPTYTQSNFTGLVVTFVVSLL